MAIKSNYEKVVFWTSDRNKCIRRNDPVERRKYRDVQECNWC